MTDSHFTIGIAKSKMRSGADMQTTMMVDVALHADITMTRKRDHRHHWGPVKKLYEPIEEVFD